jgi:hypothetical protein
MHLVVENEGGRKPFAIKRDPLVILIKPISRNALLPFHTLHAPMVHFHQALILTRSATLYS